ncbi:hypothetical protein [Cellulomonas edaphi]|uniref:DUF4265 domain-containing protein n=1 Tax=Cellulomonas edaphi TaxID=3053468 RepID=A0ABT7S5R2_9CELL|nr:hypothetical protein [Cellulomons edaphi]MDM7830392.1 hypothetical protein [Cellulomons edaphi]
MTTTPAWKPADADQGGRAFTATVGDTAVLVRFAGDPTGALAGPWTAHDADHGTLLLEGTDPDLVGTRSAVQVYASLVAISQRLSELLVLATAAGPVVEYRLLRLPDDDRAPSFAPVVEAALAEHAAAGWRLVSVNGPWAYLERPLEY